MAPEMPSATYSDGLTTLPVCPTWSPCGAYPASTAAREAPGVACAAAASGRMTASNCSLDFSERPPATMRSASVRSTACVAGLRVSVTTTSRCASVTPASTDTTDALPPDGAPTGKELGRTVKSARGDFTRTSTSALPA
jgi:hypothetical protein